MPTTKRIRLPQHSPATFRNTASGFVIVLLFAAAGAYMLHGSWAATFVASGETEDGTRSGDTAQLSATTASGGLYVQFGSAAAVNWITRAAGTNYQGLGITWRTHSQAAAGTTSLLQQDAAADNHFLMTVGQTGAPTDNSLNVQRAELEPATGYSFNRGSVYWMGYSFKLTGNPPDGVVQPSNGAWCNLMQVHQPYSTTEYMGPQPYGLMWMGDGSLVAVRRYDPAVTTTSTSFQAVETVVTPSLSTGVWHHVEARLIFDNGASSTGAMTIWLDGVKKVEQLNVPFGYNDTENNYPKMGIYRAASSGIMTAEFKNVSIGTTDLTDRTTKTVL